MEITAALLCDFAQVREGLLFVSSGGITRIFHAPDGQFPQPLGLFLALTIEVGPEEIRQVHEIRVQVVQQSSAEVIGQVIGGMQPTGATLPLAPGEAGMVPVVIPLGPIGLPELGAYDVRVSADGLAPRILTVYLVDLPPGVNLGRMHVLPTNPQAGPARPNRQQRRHPGAGGGRQRP